MPVILSRAHLGTFSLRYARSRQCSLKLQVFCAHTWHCAGTHGSPSRAAAKQPPDKINSITFNSEKGSVPCKIRTAPLQITTCSLQICALGEFNRESPVWHKGTKVGSLSCSLLQTQSQQLLQDNTKVKKDTFLVTLLCIWRTRILSKWEEDLTIVEVEYCILGMVFPNSVFPLKHSKPCTACLHLSPNTAGDWREKSEAQKVKIRG